jgi:hypothetical protein
VLEATPASMGLSQSQRHKLFNKGKCTAVKWGCGGQGGSRGVGKTVGGREYRVQRNQRRVLGGMPSAIMTASCHD